MCLHKQRLDQSVQKTTMDAMNSHIAHDIASQTERQHAATFGVPITSGDISPKRYLKKGTSGSPYASPKTSPEKTVTKRDHTITKPPVPSKDEKPVYGLVSQKNYITANAVDNILSVPPRRVSQDVDYLRKADYGQVPAYLENVKRQIQAEYDLIRQVCLLIKIVHDSSRCGHVFQPLRTCQ